MKKLNHAHFRSSTPSTHAYSRSSTPSTHARSRSSTPSTHAHARSSTSSTHAHARSSTSSTHAHARSSTPSTHAFKKTVNNWAVGSKIDYKWEHYQPKRKSEKHKSVWDQFSSKPSGRGFKNNLEPFKAKTGWLGFNKIASSMDQNNSEPRTDYSYYGPNTPKEKSLPIAKSTFNDKSNPMVERNKSCLAIESEVSTIKSLSKAFQEPSVSKKKNTIETKLCRVIVDSTNLQVNVPYTPIITSNNKNDICVINNDIQSNVKTNNDELYENDETMLINYEASDNDETSFSQTLETINNDIDICSTSGDNNQNVLNLTLNPLNEEESNLIGIPFGANIGAGQLLKAQLLLEKNKTCVRKGNEICDQTEVCEELEAKKKERNNGD